MEIRGECSTEKWVLNPPPSERKVPGSTPALKPSLTSKSRRGSTSGTRLPEQPPYTRCWCCMAARRTWCRQTGVVVVAVRERCAFSPFRTKITQ
eukprot:1156288-Pelagomonas_calceolata.AAC.2